MKCIRFSTNTFHTCNWRQAKKVFSSTTVIAAAPAAKSAQVDSLAPKSKTGLSKSGGSDPSMQSEHGPGSCALTCCMEAMNNKNTEEWTFIIDRWVDLYYLKDRATYDATLHHSSHPNSIMSTVPSLFLLSLFLLSLFLLWIRCTEKKETSLQKNGETNWHGETVSNLEETILAMQRRHKDALITRPQARHHTEHKMLQLHCWNVE